MIKRILVGLIMMCALGLAAAETPKEGAEAMLKLIKERNYSELFQKRYSEFYKAEAEGMKPAEAVEKLSTVFNKNYDRMVKIFEQLAKAEFTLDKNPAPQQTETGEIAVANITMGDSKTPYRLYKMKSGLWGFHL